MFLGHNLASTGSVAVRDTRRRYLPKLPGDVSANPRTNRPKMGKFLHNLACVLRGPCYPPVSREGPLKAAGGRKMMWILLATGFTGALTCIFLVRLVHRTFGTPPFVAVHFSPQGGATEA